MSHPYLSFQVSTDSIGYKVSGLKDSSQKTVQIPSEFSGKEVVEIGFCAFRSTNIEMVFIPKTVTFVNNGAFLQCPCLFEIRFEAESRLQKIETNAFRECPLLRKIDLPKTVQYISSGSGMELFQDSTSLSCVSYMGTTDFSSSMLFRGTSPKVHVSSSYPSGKAFGGITPTTRTAETCGVSQSPFDSISLVKKYGKERVKKKCKTIDLVMHSVLVFLFKK